MRLHRRHIDRIAGDIPTRFQAVGGWFRPVRGRCVETHNGTEWTLDWSVLWVPCTKVLGSQQVVIGPYLSCQSRKLRRSVLRNRRAVL